MEPNFELLAKVRDRIAEEPEYNFDMSRWGYSTFNGCETAACIAGWTCRVLGFKQKGLGAGEAGEVATTMLRISKSQAAHLIMGKGKRMPSDGSSVIQHLMDITKDEALAHIDKILETKVFPGDVK